MKPLNVKLISATDLKNVNFCCKNTNMDVYVVASMHDDLYYSYYCKKQKTPLDTKVDSNPTWNHTFRFNLDNFEIERNSLSIRFRVYSRRNILPDTCIGVVSVPVLDLLLGADDVKGSNLRSCQVLGSSGEQKGVLNFSYKFGDEFCTPRIRRNSTILVI